MIHRLVNYTYSLYSRFRFKCLEPNSVELKGSIKISGFIKVITCGGAKIIIHPGVRLNSNKRNSHVAMYDCVKLMTDRPGARIEIGANTRINGACLHAYNSISIGMGCLIAPNTQIIDGNGHDLSFPDVQNRINTVGSSKPIVIEDNVWIGANCFVLGGVRIGTGSVIGAGSVVDKDIPPMVIAKGNPIQIVKPYSTDISS